MDILIDNYDSFSYILHDYLLQAGSDCVVYKNDEIDVEGIKQLNPKRIILSPGPETPDRAGCTLQVIEAFFNQLPILGVCLGHQALGMYMGAKLSHASQPVHGKTDIITHTEKGIFAGIPQSTEVMRYHSLALTSYDSLPSFIPTAHSTDGTLMAFEHRYLPITGVQFHPESVGTVHGLKMIQNWCEQTK